MWEATGGGGTQTERLCFTYKYGEQRMPEVLAVETIHIKKTTTKMVQMGGVMELSPVQQASTTFWCRLAFGCINAENFLSKI